MKLRRYIVLYLVFMLFFLAGKSEAKETVTLTEAHTLALHHNHDLKNLNETLKQAEITIQRACAILLPNISLTGTITRNDEAIANPFNPAAGNVQELWDRNATLSGSIMLFSPESVPMIMNAHKGADAAKYSVLHAKSELLFGVTSAYYATLQAKKYLDVAHKNLERSKEYVRLAKARKKAGQAIRIDVLRAEIELTDAESAIIDAESAYKLALQGLGFLIGKEEFEVSEVSIDSPRNYDASEMLDHAEDNRLDLKSSKMQTDIARRSEIQSWVSFLPNFLMQANYNWTASGNFMSGNKKESWKLMFIANWDIFEGGAKIADIRENKSKYVQSKINEDKLEKEIRNQVKEAMIKLEQANAKYESSQKKQELARENYSLIKQQYELGLVDNLTMVDASTSLLQAEQSFILSELSYKLQELSLKQVSGFYTKVD